MQALAHTGEPADALHERALSLVAAALARVDAARVESGRPATARARRALVDDAREALAADRDRSLADLAGMLNVSVTQLSRLFRAATGHTIATHRMRLRARAALDRLAGGDQQRVALGRMSCCKRLANRSRSTSPELGAASTAVTQHIQRCAEQLSFFWRCSATTALKAEGSLLLNRLPLASDSDLPPLTASSCS